MIHGKMTDDMPLSLFPGSKTWETAIRWLMQNQTNTVEGVYPLGEDGFYARIMSYPLVPREKARVEAHRHTIDLQYTVTGEELIELYPTEELTPLNDYSQEKDAEHFKTPAAPHGSVTNSPGFYSIFFPVDAHMPKLATPKAASVIKIVIKIPFHPLA